MLFLFFLQISWASTPEYGRNFVVSFKDVEQEVSARAPVLRVQSENGLFSLSVTLLDDGQNPDEMAGDGVYSGTVSELPNPPMRVLMESSVGEVLWEDGNFVVPGGMDRPALRLVMKAGAVTGALEGHQSSRDATKSAWLEDVTPPKDRSWLWALIGLLGGLVLLVAADRLVGHWSVRTRWNRMRERWLSRPQRGSVWQLGEGLPEFRDGLQVWVSEDSWGDLRSRLVPAKHGLGAVFWVPKDAGGEGLDASILMWEKSPPSAGEVLSWRNRLHFGVDASPVFIESLDALYHGDFQRLDTLEDLAEMANGPVILLSRKADLPVGWAMEPQDLAGLLEANQDVHPL